MIRPRPILLGAATILLVARAQVRAQDALSDLSHPDPRRREEAQAEILRRGADGVPLLVEALCSADVETRRFATRALPALLRTGSRDQRLAILGQLGQAGGSASGIAPGIDAFVAESAGEVRYAAMAASMLVSGNRRYVLACARGAGQGKPGALDALRAAAPAEAPRLLRTSQLLDGFKGAPGDEELLRNYALALIGEVPGLDEGEILASGVRRPEATTWSGWADLLELQPSWPPALDRELAARVRAGLDREIRRLLGAVLRAPANSTPPLTAAALHDRFTEMDRPTRVLAALALGPSAQAQEELDEELDEDFIVQILHSHPGGQTEKLLAALGAADRARVLDALLSAASARQAEWARWFLGQGKADETGRMLSRLGGTPLGRALLGDLEALLPGSTPRDAIQAVDVVASCDPGLTDPAARRIFLSCLRDPRSEVRSGTLFRCEKLESMPGEIAQAIEGLLWEPGARPILYFTLNRAARLGSKGRALAPLLVRVLTEDPPARAGFRPSDVEQWRRLAARVLLAVESFSGRSRAAFLTLLRSNDPALRGTALAAVAGGGTLDKEVRAAVSRLLSDPQENLRREAQRLLER